MAEFNIPRLRLQYQHLTEPQFTQPADIVRWMGAVQAQDYGGAVWALGQRLKGNPAELIEKAFIDGSIIRTHVMRPTWHFVVPEDIRWMLELTAPRVQAVAGTRNRRLELNDTIFAKCVNTITRALEGGRQMERNEVSSVLKQAGIAINEERFIHIMMELELRRLVCSGGRRGRQFTYALLDERVPAAKAISREEALVALADRYFTAHGPATLHDYAWWSGLTVADSKAGLEAVKTKLISEVYRKNTYYHTGQPMESAGKSIKAFLLPNYDEYIVSYKDRSATIHENDISKADPRGTIFNNTIIINGRIVGTWKREFKKSVVEIDITPFKPLSPAAHTAIKSAAGRYAKFLGLKGFTLNV